jgi:hypothetical protein
MAALVEKGAKEIEKKENTYSTTANFTPIQLLGPPIKVIRSEYTLGTCFCFSLSSGGIGVSHRSGLQGMDQHLRTQAQEVEEKRETNTHLNSEASSPQMSLSRFKQTIGTKIPSPSLILESNFTA